ncbi:MAG: HNH endonuclease [Thermodesulfobacteriota bacterium]
MNALAPVASRGKLRPHVASGKIVGFSCGEYRVTSPETRQRAMHDLRMAAHRHLLTVHHRDGNHQNNPADGRNWENLCVYCHEDIHSRGLLGDYLEGTSVSREESVVYRDESNTGRKGLMTLGDQLKRALEKKKQQP